MNILHISSYDVKGGAETVFNITRNVPNHINQAAYIKLDSNSPDSCISFSSWEDNNFLVGAINYVFSRNNYKTLLDFLTNNDIDIIHLQGFFSTLSPSILLAIKKIKRTNKIKVVQTLHEFHVICPNSSLYNFTKNNICEKCIGNNLKLRIAWNNCDKRGRVHSILKSLRSFVSNNILKHKEVVDKFICPSNFLKSKMIEDGVSADKLIVIRNPIELVQFTEATKKQNVICYFGRFSYEKQLNFLIEAFCKWKSESKNNFELHLIGNGEETASLLKLASESKYEKSIIFKDFLPHNELLKEINSAKYFSLTSSCYENAPMSIIEAQSLNIIPISPDIGGMKESIEDLVTVGRTFKANTIDSWIEVMNQLEKDYDNLFTKMNNAVGEFRHKYDSQSYYEALNNFYNQLTN